MDSPIVLRKQLWKVLTKFGVTTVVGCLGTDGIGRDMCALVAKAKGLNEQGMSAYCYTGQLSDSGYTR